MMLPMNGIPCVDISAFCHGNSSHESVRAARELVAACHQRGFVSLTGLGISSEIVEHAFKWSKQFFALSHNDKMKAPHPAAHVPHRGYSYVGAEKVYSKSESVDKTVEASNGETLRKVQDYKESYEIGSEANLDQPNIWLPEEVLPGFREFEIKLYWTLHAVCTRILQAICVGLELSTEDTKYALELHSGVNNQLRLLHYPEVEAEKIKTQVLARMPAHSDWRSVGKILKFPGTTSSFTILFQDTSGGLELEDTSNPGTWIPAVPTEGAVILNVGDMLERLSNDYLRSATHRVTLPYSTRAPMSTQGQVQGGKDARARYSIPYFYAPDPNMILTSFISCVSSARPRKYEPIRWKDYGELRGKYSYQQERDGKVKVAE